MYLKLLMLRRKQSQLQQEQATLRTQQACFQTREAELAAQIQAAETEEAIAAVSAAVDELETTQKTVKERLEAIQGELEEIVADIEEAEAAADAAASAGGDGGSAGDGENRSRRSSASWMKRCRDFQRTGRMVYENARSMIKRAALLSSGITGPTGVSGINDDAGNTVSDFIDLVKVTDCTGMATYKVAYMNGDPAATAFTEGAVPSEGEPTFGYVELKPSLVGLIAYISREIRKQTPLQYEQKVKEAVTRALRRMLSKIAVDAVLASSLNTALTITVATGAALFTPSLLSNIILSYGGDEGVDGAAVLVLNKADLKAFAAVRGTNEYLPVYSITPDATNPSGGVIKDNNGLSCRYCLNKNVTALSTASLSGTAKKGMFYGNPQCLELGVWGGIDVDVNDGYKFGEGLLTIRGEVAADADVTTKNGFVVVSAKTA